MSSFFVRILLPEGLAPPAREALSAFVPRLASTYSFQGMEDWAIDVKNSRVLGVEAEFQDLSRAGKRNSEMRVYFAKKSDGAEFVRALRRLFSDLTVKPPRKLAPRDWMKAWRKHYKTQILREGALSLAIVPAWKKAPKHVSLSVRIYPGQAFGTGTHPTTQLCLRLFLRHGNSSMPRHGNSSMPRQGPSGKGAFTALDFGAGTGVLALAAEKWCRASGRIFRGLAVEIDPVALAQCRKNARLNQARKLRFLRQTPARLKADLVFANVLAPVLLAERPMLLGSVKSGGLLLLSGLLASEAKAFLKQFKAKGFELVENAREGDWAAIALRRT